MWALVPRNTQILIISALSITIAWGADGIYEIITAAKTTELKFISLVATIISGIVAVVVGATWRWLWGKFPRLGRLIFPDLTGTWQGELVSTWKDAGGQGVPPIPMTIWVRQGFFTTSIKLRTGESSSYSTRCLLEADPGAGRYRFWYSYDNSPQAQHRHRSARHEGVAWLELDLDADPTRLRGCYYTDRKTSGDMDVHRTRRDIAS